MTTHLTSTTRNDQPAHTNPHLAHSTPGRTAGPHRGKGVTDVNRFGRRVGEKRAWDELSDADRHVLLVQARQRRAEQAQRDARFIDVYAQRLNK